MSDIAIPATCVAALTCEMGYETVLTSDYHVKQPSELAPGECLIKLECTGVCHSDLHFMLGDWSVKPRLPSAGGHEGVGRVVAIGEHTTSDAVKVGDRVGTKYIGKSCLSCDPCRSGYEQHCFREVVSGCQTDGSFAQYTVGFVDHVVPIPENLPSEVAAPILCAGLTVYSALKQAHAIAGNWIAIPGAGGGLGTLAIQYAVAMGLRVIAIDTGGEKHALTLSLGAEIFVDFAQSTNVVADIIAAADGLGPQVTLVTTPSNPSYAQALLYTRMLGTILCVGLPVGLASGVNFMAICGKGLRLIGCKTGNRQASIESLDLVARGKIQCTFKEKPFAEINDVLEQMKNGTLAGRIVLKY